MCVVPGPAVGTPTPGWTHDAAATWRTPDPSESAAYSAPTGRHEEEHR